MIKDIIIRTAKTPVTGAAVQYSLWGWGDGTQGQLDSDILAYNPYNIDSGTSWVSGSGGTAHTVAIKSDGTMWGWGLNNAGQIGDGTTTTRSSPVQVGSLTDWSKISAGSEHNHSIKTNGTLWAWGNNTSGQIGDISTVSRSSPVQIGTLTDWSKVSAGGEHSLSVKTDGSLWSWGFGTSGQLGDGSAVSKSSPVQIGTLTNWSKISVGASHSMAIKTDGTLWAWGNNANGELGNEPITPTRLNFDTWSDVDGGYSYTMGIKGDGTLWGWGFGTNGQLGIPIPISPIQLDSGGDWAKISVGDAHSTAIKTDGTLWSWGSNSGGKLGLNDSVTRNSPVQVGTLTDWLKVSAGQSHTMSIKSDGTLWGWGQQDISNPPIGDNSVIPRSSPVQIGTLTDWLEISAGGLSSAAIKTDGTLWTWGRNLEGQLGNGTSGSTAHRSSPIQIGTLTNWHMISVGGLFVHSIKTDGTLWSWGWNGTGQLGLGNTILRNSPVQVGTLTDWSNVWSGNSHTMAVKTDGTLWGWGLNTNGQLGDGTRINRSSPVQIGSLTNWLRVVGASAFSGTHTIAVKTDGTLWSWGANPIGQLGDGTVVSRSSPVQIGTLTNWSDISAGTDHSVAIDTSNNLYVWGNNSSGQLGLNDTTINVSSTGYSSPTQIGTGTTWSKVSTASGFTIGKKTDGTLWSWGGNATIGVLGLNELTTKFSPVQIGTDTDWDIFSSFNLHTLAIKTNGTLWAWGNNTSGRIGDISTVSRSSPVQIGTLTDWSKVSAGGEHSLSVKTDGSLWSWGFGTSGQLGDGSAVSKSSPIQIGTLTNWSKVSAGLSHSMAIKTDGTLWAWGGDGSGELGIRPVQPTLLSGEWDEINISNFAQIPVIPFYNNTFGVKTDGTLWSWGYNASGQLGVGDTVSRSSPIQIGTLTDWVKTSSSHSDNTNVLNTSTVWGLRNDGTLWAWGAGSGGQHGTGVNVHRSSPVQVVGTGWIDVCGFSPSSNSSTTIGAFALKTDGTLWAWGLGVFGTNGNGTTSNSSVPVQIGTSTDWASIPNNGSGIHAIAIKTNGTIWAWGRNEFGQLGDGTKINRSSPVQIGTLTNWSKISCGFDHSISIKTDGTLWGWGRNNSGQLGDGTVVNKSSPIQIGTDTNWSKITAGTGHSMAIKTDGTLWGWGLNTVNQIGNGDFISKSSPVQIGTLTNWTKVVGGQNYTMAINDTNDLYVWGANYIGEWGDNTTFGSHISTVSSPIQVGTLTTWSEVWATNQRTYATKTDGTLWGWGAATNYLGDTLASNLGLGTFPTTPTTRYSPVQIGTKTDWTEIGRGQNHIVGLKSDGSMLGWGVNTNGQLGLNFFGSNTNRSSPVQIGDDTFWSEVAAGTNHTLAVKTDGTLWGWGLNTSGRIGDISVVSRSYPVQIGTLTTWSKVDAAIDYSRAVKTDGTLWTWGDNTGGKLGDATIVSKSSPVQVGTRGDWTTFNGVGSHSVAITTGKTLWTWGLASSGQLGYTMQRSSPVQIGDGYSWSKIDGGDLALHTMGVKTNGTLWGWGANNLGQLGDNTVIYRSSPVQIGTLTNWSNVNLSISHTMGLKTDGTLWGWGRNNSGQIGDGTAVDKSSPVQIGTSTGWARVSAGGNADTTMFTMAVKTDGTLWGWGSITNGKIGTILPYVPQRVGTTSEWATVANNVNDTIDFSFSLGIKTDGSLWSWGLNSSGQLGLNNTSTTNSPVQVGTLTNWLSVAAGRSHTIAVKSDGTLWAWGGNSVAGELGDGTFVSKSSPIQIGTLTDWSKVSVGFRTSHAVKTDGTLWGWGQNADGKIGDGTLVSKNSPVQVGTLTNWLKIVGSSSHTMAVKTDGTLWGWGGNASGQIGDGTVINRSSPVQIGTLTNWYNISVQGAVTIATKTDGTLWGWGAGGRIGDSTSVSRSSPVQIGTLTTWSDTFSQNGNSFAIKTDGTLWGWGRNTRGQLGNGGIDPNGFSPITSPIQISSDISWSTMSKGGSYSSLAIDTSGNLYSWGQNTSGELGLSNFVSYNVTTATTPGQVGNETSWSQLSLGADHGIATKTTGTLWAWGVNGAGQIGDNTVTTRSSPIQIGTLTDWSKVSAGASHTMAIKTDGSLWAWGLGTSAQLGIQSFIPSWPLDRSSDWSDISFNRVFLGVKNDGTLWGWGFNDRGQLGDGTIINRSSPVQIGTLTDWSKVFAGALHSVAIKTDGTLWSWGGNSTGALGQNNTINRSSPVQIGTDTDWMTASVTGQGALPQGGGSTFGIKTNGTLWAWGLNVAGALGDGTTISRSSPVQIGTLTNWLKIFAAEDNGAMSIKTDGTLWMWGSNNAGQAGQNTTSPTTYSSPVQVGTDNDWQTAVYSFRSAMAIKTNGTLWGWGDNSSGQLGDGTFVNRSSPVQIGTDVDWYEVIGGGSATSTNISTSAIKTNGTLWGWGSNSSGQIGNQLSSNSPIQIGKRTDWSNIYGKLSSRVGKKTDGTLRVWGQNDFGELGRGFVDGLVSRSSPIQIGDDQWSSVYAGNVFTIGIKTDGTLWSWGINTAGYLGNGLISTVRAPFQIGTYSKWTQVSAGASHTIAIREE